MLAGHLNARRLENYYPEIDEVVAIGDAHRAVFRIYTYEDDWTAGE